MKANHNDLIFSSAAISVGLNISNSKNESKSQPLRFVAYYFIVGLNISNSKNESKSQLPLVTNRIRVSWVKYQ
ncbi:hypothetical protein GO621_09415 [Mucilaginibacter sp. HMF7410]|uniref:Uncharacterized protein n=1 Tax=Mucilaginibacter arboris TaxID=2682090 RepID=A0A7K1SWS7_9SPHI|nr:hypothetical protein [Mucilaginibacter arboris]MVN21754.1 hypothetical protein [Mucilaginibacter arboris]